jgi:hypothetical protein
MAPGSSEYHQRHDNYYEKLITYMKENYES